MELGPGTWIMELGPGTWIMELGPGTWIMELGPMGPAGGPRGWAPRVGPAGGPLGWAPRVGPSGGPRGIMGPTGEEQRDFPPRQDSDWAAKRFL